MFNELDKKKLKIDSKRPFPIEVLNNLKNYFDVELTYNSNAIEGNTLTLTETKVILENGVTIGKGKSLREHLEVINHKEAIDYIKDIVTKNIDITERIIRELHYIILKSIDNKNAGHYRSVNVLISGSEHRPPEHFLVDDQMHDLLHWYNENKTTLHPVEMAAIFHHKFTFIHPFADGNGRTGRLLMNLILLRNGYPMAVIKNSDRDSYMSALEIASSKNDYSDFLKVVSSAVNNSLDTYLYLLS